MTVAMKPTDGAPRRSVSVARSVAVRFLFYGALGIALGCYFDCIPWNWFHVGVRRQDANGSPSDPGWPHIRGAEYSGMARNSHLAEFWPTAGPPVLWTRDIGPGYSGAIVVGNRVFTQTQTLTEQEVLALDADTGQLVWKHGYGWPYDPGGMYPGPRATPTWFNDRIYFASPEGTVGCLRAADGRRLWTVDLRRRFGMSGHDFGYACSPMVEDGKVILPVGGRSAAVVALDANSGETLWASGDAAASYCSAIPITFRGERQVVAFLRNELDGFDLTSGRLLWRKSYSNGYDEHAAFPLYEEPFLRTMQPFRAGSDLYRLEFVGEESRASDQSEFRLAPVRHDRQMSNDIASSVLVDGIVYGFDLHAAQTSPHRPSKGLFRAIDFKSGEVRWSSDRPGHAAIAVADGKLVLLNDRGELVLARATPDKYEELARTAVFSGEVCWTATCLDRSRAYLRSPSTLVCLYLGPPEGLDRQQQAAALPVSALSKECPRLLGRLVGSERANPFDLPDFRELARWYLFSLAAIAAAGVLGCAVWLLVARATGRHRGAARSVFWLALLTLGGVATPMGNSLKLGFVFTWPVSLLAMHQFALAAACRARSTDSEHRIDWRTGFAVAVLIFACAAYYEITRRLAIAPAWFFLPTFLAAWPLAIPAARKLTRSNSLLGDFAWMVCVFSLYFWATGGLLLWRASTCR